jgi:hypothetical protein
MAIDLIGRQLAQHLMQSVETDADVGALTGVANR